MFKQVALDAYNSGKPILSDAEWDALFKNDGSDSLGTKGKVKLPKRMGSLKKFFVGEDTLPSDIHRYVKTPKYDGCAIGIMYYGGALMYAATRGDGEYGTDITERVKLIDNIPINIDTSRTVWVTGEVVLPSTEDNSRNVVAGFLNRLYDWQPIPNMKFVMYDAQFYAAEGAVPETYLHSLDWHEFDTVLSFQGDSYPKDGTVFRLLDNKEFYDSGFTGNYKNGSFALKERSEGVKTTLIDVVWQTGKSGKVTPVAILSPVNIGGAMVSRATLHNFSFIEELGLYAGALVKVERSGEIIPRIIGLAAD